MEEVYFLYEVNMRLVSEKKEDVKQVIFSFKQIATTAGQKEIAKLLDQGVRVFLITHITKELFEINKAKF